MKHRLIYWLVARFYNYLAGRDREAKVTFMNFGFAGTQADDEAAEANKVTNDGSVSDRDARRRALYLKVAGGIGASGWVPAKPKLPS